MFGIFSTIIIEELETLTIPDKSYDELIEKQKSISDSLNQLNLDLKDVHLIQVRNIKQLYPEIFDWLKLQDMNVLVIIILMLIGVNHEYYI